MIRAISILCLAAILAGCNATESGSGVPSGSEPPRLTVTVLAGTKAAPVDTPVVRVEWAHQDSIVAVIYGQRDREKTSPGDTSIVLYSRPGVGVESFRLSSCIDSIQFKFIAYPINQVDTLAPYDAKSRKDSVTVYCK